jgi:large conductance mechanosensitive channel
MFKEFRDFAFKGNFLDLAIGVVIGAAFGAATSAFVVNLVNPLIGLVAGGQDFSNLFVTLKEGATAGPYTTLAAAQAAGAVTLNIGLFLNAIINLLLVAFVMFMVVKAYNKAVKKEEEAPAPPPEPSAEEKLLTEIRDLLAKN